MQALILFVYVIIPTQQVNRKRQTAVDQVSSDIADQDPNDIVAASSLHRS